MNNIISISNSVVRNQALFDLGRSSREQVRSITRIATGSRLADTSEDPGAYAVSLKLKLTGNALDGVEKGLMNAQSFLQMQGDGLVAIGRALERMNEIATQVQDATRSTEDQRAGILEMNALREEIVRLQGESLNGQRLFVKYAGGAGETPEPLSIALGESGRTLDLTRSDFSAGDASNAWIFLLGNESPYEGIGTDTAEGLAAFGQSGFDTLQQSVSALLAQNGADQSRVASALDQARTRRIHTEAAGSRVSDVDVAKEVARLGRTNIKMDATRSVLVQANVLADLAVKLLG